MRVAVRAAFSLECIEKANPHADEEPENWFPVRRGCQVYWAVEKDEYLHLIYLEGL